MSRRQLIRHTAWFGAAVSLAVVGGEVISYVAGTAEAGQVQGRAALPNDTVIIVFSHIPLFAMSPDWGWGTDDAAQALTYLRRFSSVTCLNGHVRQVLSKTAGNVTFYSGTTTAYPLPRPGDGWAPKPLTLPAGKLRDALGIREVSYTRGHTALALKEACTAMTFTESAARIGIPAAPAVSGISHAYLYIHGYRHIPTIGAAFVLQASVSFAIAVLILIGGLVWLRWAAAMAASGALLAFGLSRTGGLFGFSERGWQPTPHAAVSVTAELLTVALWAAYLVGCRRATAR
jgi:hypothetical protein